MAGTAGQPPRAASSKTGDALDERADDARLADRAGTSVEQVAVEHRQVGQLADLERAGLVEVVDVRGARR